MMESQGRYDMPAIYTFTLVSEESAKVSLDMHRRTHKQRRTYLALGTQVTCKKQKAQGKHYKHFPIDKRFLESPHLE